MEPGEFILMQAASSARPGSGVSQAGNSTLAYGHAAGCDPHEPPRESREPGGFRHRRNLYGRYRVRRRQPDDNEQA